MITFAETHKGFCLVGDFHINVLDYDVAFQCSWISRINKTTRITRTNATAIDHIFTNAFLINKFEQKSSKL